MSRDVGDQIPPDRLARNPLITPAAFRRLNAILQHPDAPAWNYAVGDRVRPEDLPHVESIRRAVRENRAVGTGGPPAWVFEWIRAMRPRVRYFREVLPEGFDIERDWDRVPAMNREHIAGRIEDIVPLDADISRMIVYDTSGVTGHALRVPHHPRAMAQNHPLMEFVLDRFGIRLDFSHDTVACLNVGAQLDTVVFATVLAAWNNAGFAKVNLHRRRWDADRCRRFFRDMAPLFLTGDPVGFSEMMKWGVDARPAAMLSTAVALDPGLKSRLEAFYRCPVIDTYALTETGVVAYSNPEGEGMNILPHDIYVEIVDGEGRPVPEGEKGEICVTGGRNPFVPLLRYRTGDFSRMVWTRTAPSDPTPRLIELEAREAVSFMADDGTILSPVDVGRVIRKWIFIQHELVQRADGSCEMTVRPAPGCPVDAEAMRENLAALFGPSFNVSVRIDERLGEDRPGGKLIPFRSEMRAGD